MADVAAAHALRRTLGFAACNALSRTVMDRMGFAPPRATDSIGGIAPQAGDHVGMVGLFSPLLKQVTAAGALRGYQDTRATMLITLLAYWGIGLPVGYALGLSDWLGQPSGPSGLWQGLVAGLTCAAVLLGIRLARSARRHIRA